ncbi:hypothetical protein RHMOL_Rhmol10G0049400 [Rhododendron molle]|uniref:Uncharacterized protein n=1 Tax=Rhododendron molle TaxID=49168 RepID=A0ACC0M028_RHOML|nr:hypothetical protein RHMOL_Rhmol10G0049400 [Rhododendron molle]
MVAGTNQIVKEALEDCFETQRDWILGFFGKLVCNSSLEAELCGIYRGLTIFWRKAVELINEGNLGNHTQSIIITEAHGLLNRTSTKYSHTYCNANQLMC